MRVQKRIPFRSDSSPELVSYLKENQIQFAEGQLISVLELYEDSPHWPFVEEMSVRNEQMIQSETVFSKKEMASAEWLSVRSTWRCGYPQPEDGFGYQAITYNEDCYCTTCGTGLIQKDSFRLKGEPNWGKRHFMMPNWVEDELFLDAVAKTALEMAGIPGISFLGVKNKSGKEDLPNTYQLQIPHILPPALVEAGSQIRNITICPECGIKKYGSTGIGMWIFKRQPFECAPDMVKTAEVFGWGHLAPRMLLIRQNVYQLLVSKKLDRGLEFQPIQFE